LTEVLKDTNVTVNSLHPGVVKTSIGDKNNSSWVGAIWKLGKLFMISEEEGAKTSIFLASDPSVSKTSGRYFDKCKAQAPNPSANDKDKLAKLWEVSMEQTGLAG
jgi:NAD(P)-dependent dehydrogenase (short-subunit alcohol dehydrogenase family)